MKIFLDVIGCRLNQSEVEAFASVLSALGHEIVPDPAQADVAIVNTCAVTVKAAADSRKQIRRAKREGARAVVVTGCWATLEPDAAHALPGVSEVFDNTHKDDLLPVLLNKTHDEISALEYIRTPLPGERVRTRAFIKVQEGCDYHCTYCLTRLVRGPSRSREVSEIQRDIKAALDGGSQEIVLTGVQLGGWGRDLEQPQSIKDLLALILTSTDVARVRLSSIEPWEFDLEMLPLWQDERMCRHLHIPLQSGSDRVLKRMGRLITADGYLNLIDQIRAAIPDVALTTDVITGFPGEEAGDIDKTIALIKQVGFSGGHVFTYSPRPGTAAEKMDRKVERSTAKARNALLRKTFENSSRAFRDQFIGRSMPVLWESSNLHADGTWGLSGLTGHYLRVYAESPVDLWNRITPARLSAHHPGRAAFLGEIDGSFAEVLESGA